MDLLNYPGNLGSVRGSLLTVHHCNWPSYPQGEDFRETLFYLSAFPFGTEFVEVDDCDRSILFLADVSCGRLSKPYHHRNFHVCSWHEDLIEMHNRGFLIGVERVTEKTHACRRWDNILQEFNTDKLYVSVDGKYREVPAPVREPEDEDEDRDWVTIPTKRISVTSAGMTFIVNEIKKQNVDYAATLSPTVAKLLNDKLFDVAVREACVTLEHTIKAKLESNRWGDLLTDEFLEYLRDKENVLESSLRTYAQELRTVFKLVRNVFLHNLKIIDEAAALVLLFRISRVKNAIEM
jgi:hypothetical protein